MLANPDTEVTSATFGRIRASNASYTPRNLQLGLRLDFYNCGAGHGLRWPAVSSGVTRLKFAILLGFLLASTAPAADLFRDDFSRFPPGWLQRLWAN